MKTYLGLFLIGMVVYLFWKNRQPAKRESIHPGLPILLGLIGGFIGGIFAVGGPFFVFYFMMRYPEKYAYNANLQATFFYSKPVYFAASRF